jgi:tRNA dimethylallyltransferase
MSSKHLIVIVGPTAIGKTTLSVEIAKEFKTEIISADSRQLFKEISIGTAKPGAEEMHGVKHHFINTHSITEDYNAGKYEQEALLVISELFKKKDVLIMTGGSGLYVDAICKGFDVLPESDEKTRKKLNDLFETKGTEALVELLKQHDPEYYQKVDLSNPHRIIRALEVSMISGTPFSSLLKGKKAKRPFNIIKIGLDTDREILYQKINQRVDEMIKKGFLEEVKQLHSLNNISILKTVGYKELIYHLEGKYDLANAIELIKKNTRNFAKRQLTWFRKDKEVKWFMPENKKEIIDYLNAQLSIA